ncbi:MAG TPA: tRNA (adenosine(37)-N6)-threonylcarbamoyltransferase complex dimerization subunit type 1 TsaB [Sphingobacteriaceae bacterium]
MALILQIETATTACSVALSKDGQTVSYCERNAPNIHASQLTLFIEDVLKQVSVTFSDLDAVAVSKGPGSYTGLRIGVSTAKGLCYALDIPLIGVDTLEAMAAGFRSSGQWPTGPQLLCPMIDARRMEVYMEVFDADLTSVQPVQAVILTEATFDQYGEVVLFGDGAKKCKALYAQKAHVHIVDFENSARHLSEPCHKKFMKRQFENVAYFEPFYLKEFVAGKPKA